MDRGDVQVHKAYQKQPTVSLLKVQKLGRRSRYWKDVGMGFVTPKEAKEGAYIDKKCPFTGNVSIRGRIINGAIESQNSSMAFHGCGILCIRCAVVMLFQGMVISTKMKRTIIMRVNYLHYIKKYNRFEKRHRNIACHCSPCFEPSAGDIVTVGQCRPLSKTVRFNVLKVEKNQIFGNPRKQFRLF